MEMNQRCPETRTPSETPATPARPRKLRALPVLSLAVLLILGGCRKYDYDPRDLENDASEAVIRHMLENLPELEPQVPKIHTITLSEGMAVPRRSFVQRFDDLDITWVSGNQLIIRSEDNRIIDAESKLSPITFQVSGQDAKPDGAIAVTGAWAYKDIWQRRVFIVRQGADGGFEVEPGELLGQSETQTL